MELKRYSMPILRIALSLVFLYFGYQQLTAPENWIGFVPSYALVFGFSAKTFVTINSFLEIGFGTLMLIGLYTRVSAFILALHLFGIAFSIGFNPLGVRDFGLAFSTLVVFMNGMDELCVEKRWQTENL